MKALARERADRYPNVAALSADVEAWQGGFSTSAQNAGPWTEWKLFMVRHRVVTTLVALMLAVSAGFVIKVIASEHRATQNAVLASQNEQHALREKEATRQAFAQSQIAVADAAAERLDTTGLQAALAACPPDLRDSSWHYLAAKANAAIATLPIHSYGAVFRHTGQGKAGGEFLVAHMHAPVISVIEPHTGRVLREWKTALPDRKVLGLRADGTELIVSSEWDQEFEILNCATGASVLHRRLASGGFLERPMLSPDGSRILTILVGPDNSRRLVAMDRSTGAILWEQPGWFYCGFSRDTAWAAVMNVASKAVAVIRTDTGEVVCNMEPGHSFLWDLRFSEDNERVAGADYEGYATVWDRASGRRLQSFRVCGGNVQAAAFTANGTLVTRGLESADRNSQRRIQIWNPARVVQLAAFLGGGTSGSNSMALDPGRGWLCTDGTETRVWQVPVQRHRQVIQCSHPAMMATFLGNEVLITQHGLSPPQMWRIGARETTPLTPDPAAGGIFSTGGDGTRVLFTDGKKDRVRLATLAGEGTVHFENPAWAMTGPCVALDPSGTRAAAGNMGDRILLFTAGQARCVRELFVPEVAVWKLVAFTGGGGRVLAAGTGSRQNDFLACWDTETGALIHLLSSVSPILALAVSPDGTRFARAGADKIIYIHHAADCRPELSFRAHDAAINGLAWHPSRPLLASVSDDLSLKLWNPGTGELLTRALGLSRSLLCTAFSADGKTLAAGTADPAVLVFDTDSLEAN